MPQDNPASHVPHAGAGGGGEVGLSLKAKAFWSAQLAFSKLRRAFVGDIPRWLTVRHTKA